MPRSSPYHITLSKAEADELSRRAAKYTLPYFQVVRAKIVLLAAQGLSNYEITTRLDTPGKSSASGASVSLRNASPAWTSAHAQAGPGFFPQVGRGD